MKGIYSLQGVEVGALYTTDGQDVWEVQSYCQSPTITLKNLRTGHTTGGAVGCPNVADFVRLVKDEPKVYP